jgi:hypothetical protein
MTRLENARESLFPMGNGNVLIGQGSPAALRDLMTEKPEVLELPARAYQAHHSPPLFGESVGQPHISGLCFDRAVIGRAST